MRTVARFLVLGLAQLIATGSATAATLEPSRDRESSGCNMRLDGEIVEGDLDRLMSAVGDKYGLRGTRYTVCLSSLGGNLAEGIRIADFLLQRRIATRIEAGKECLSACSIVFMAGTESRVNLVATARSMSMTSRLAFHSPRPPAIAGRVDTDQAYDAAVEAIGRQLLRLARHRELQWTQPLMKPELINEMMLTSHTRWYEIDSIGKAAKYGIDLTDAPVPPTASISTVRHLCFNTLALVYDTETASRYFNIELAGYTVGKAGNGDDAAGGVEGTLHALRIRYKFGRCNVIAHPSGDNYRVAVTHGANTHPVEFVPSWYAFPPERPLDPKTVAAQPKDVFCDAPQTPTEQTVCTYGELQRFERLAQNYIRRVRAREMRTSAKDGTYSEADEKAWRAELAACKGDYICTSNSYTNLLFHTFRWGRLI